MLAKFLILVCVVCTINAHAGEPKNSLKPEQAEPHRHAQAQNDQAERSVREIRPASLAASFVGKTPFFGAQADINLLPYIGLGIGFGYFTSGSVSGSFVPVTLLLYPLKGNFTPFAEVGADFVTVKFESANSLLNSTFKGTQLIVGGGLEYRFDFGLLLRADAVRFLNAKIWSPGLQVGYSFQVD